MGKNKKQWKKGRNKEGTGRKEKREMLLMPRCPLLQEPMGMYSSWVSGMPLILRLLLLWVCFLSSRCIIIIIHSRQIWTAADNTTTTKYACYDRHLPHSMYANSITATSFLHGTGIYLPTFYHRFSVSVPLP